MNLTSDTIGAAAVSPASSKSPVSAASASDFDMFLKMLTAQIRNQDPLEPMDSADYAVQLATFSGVEQQVKTNDMLAALAASMGSGGLSDIAGWVGREARAPMPAQFDGAPIPLDFKTQAGADAGELVVTDATGREVWRHAVSAGTQSLDWAGVSADGYTLPSGPYGFELVSLAEGEEIGRETVETYGRVREVRLGADGPMLVINGGSEVASAAVTALREAL